MIEEDEYTQEELDAEMDEGMQELEAFFAQAPAIIIGDGKVSDTDMVEWVDPEEVRYNLKMGLSEDGTPMEVHRTLEMALSIPGVAFNEGYEVLDMDGDDSGSGLSQFNEPSGFNQW